MSIYLAEMDPRTGHLMGISRDKGSELHAAYEAAYPFPHTVIENFLPPEILDRCLAGFPTNAELEFNRAQERFKRQFNPDELSSELRNLFYSFNSRPFIRVIENITGIQGLIPDPYFLGGGFHEIGQGGHLSIHADFNHHKPMNLERRVNVLIYLNRDWKDDYGGQLELWENDLSKCVHSIVPLFNRCVIFNTTLGSNHGNPQPIRHPEGINRRSIALYYYTSTWDGLQQSHTTQFRARPGTTDRTDWQVRMSELADDIVPPVLVRNYRRVKHKIRKTMQR